MIIASIHVYPVKIRNGPIYLGDSLSLSQARDYYLRPEFRSIYSRRLETVLVKITTDEGIHGWGEALAPVGSWKLIFRNKQGAWKQKHDIRTENMRR